MGLLICRHVYESVGSADCPDCGKPSHDVDWKQEHELRKAHREKYGILYNVQREWWSI